MRRGRQLNNRVLLPVLGDPYGKALEAQQICLAFQEGAFVIQYFEHRFPVAPHSYAVLLNHALADLEQKLEATDPFLIEYQSILTAVTHLPHGDETDPARIAEQRREKEVVKRRLAALAQDAVEVRSAIATTITLYNGQPGDPHSFDLLDRFLGQQAYRLSYWRVAADEINYRRFFDVNELAALSTEKLEVFLATHDLVLRLLCQGKIDGLRVDHPDGLFDPREYLSRLQQYYLLGMARAALGSDPPDSEEWQEAEAALLKRGTPHACAAGSLPGDKPLYVVVEKILGPAEELPADWHTHGTTGYEFLGAINGVFLDRRGEEPLSQLYRQWTGTDQRFADLVYHKKSLILRDTLSSELHMLGRQLDRLAQKSRHSRDFTGNSLRFALREIIAFFPLYRSYISDEGVHESDRRQVELAVARAMRHNPTVSGALFRFVRDVLLLVYPDSATDEERAEQRRVAGKFQQVTSPVMAKGVEDTAFYVYNRLLSLNEVGGDPSRFGTAPESLHQYLQSRQAHWPHALSTLSTHDTKRSEDVRARLNVLSELPQEWQENVTRWKHLNEPHRTVVDDAPAPDANEEYLIYQTLLGAWPIEPCSGAAYSHFIERIQAYMTKAIHEAKVHTSWINPDEAYDEAVRRFVERIMDPNTGAAFLREFAMFQRRVSHFGLINSLAQTLLKLTAPGVPDTYQGTELWDFSLADPDNRRPVDYDRREKALRDLDHLIDQAGADRAGLPTSCSLPRKTDGSSFSSPRSASVPSPARRAFHNRRVSARVHRGFRERTRLRLRTATQRYAGGGGRSASCVPDGQRCRRPAPRSERVEKYALAGAGHRPGFALATGIHRPIVVGQSRRQGDGVFDGPGGGFCRLPRGPARRSGKSPRRKELTGDANSDRTNRVPHPGRGPGRFIADARMAGDQRSGRLRVGHHRRHIPRAAITAC